MAGERERGGRERSRDREERDSEFVDKLVHINRVAKVVKGGKRFGFAALVVIGDQKGRVGFGHGKAREVPEAIRKATESAKRNLTRVALREGRTLHHDIAGRHGAGRVGSPSRSGGGSRRTAPCRPPCRPKRGYSANRAKTAGRTAHNPRCQTRNREQSVQPLPQSQAPRETGCR